MSRKRVIVTIVNSIGPTSMPFNEFAIYRSKHISQERHVVLALCDADRNFVEANLAQWESLNLRVTCCNNSYFQLRREFEKLVRQSRETKEKLIVHMHHSRASLGLQVLNLLFLRRIPTLFTIHNMVPWFPFASRFLWYMNFVLADYITFVSHYSQDVFPGFLKRVRSGSVQSIPNGMDLERVDGILAKVAPTVTTKRSGADSKNTQSSFKLVNIGRLNEQKNQDWLLRLLAELPDNVTLTIVGEGKLHSALESLARELGVAGRLRLAGLLPREEVFRELLDADVFVSPSLWEGLPIAVLEAMALRRPIIVSDIGPHKEIGDCGGSVKILPLETDRWVEQIKEFMQRDRSELDEIGDKNREIVESNFTLDRMHKEYDEVYKLLARESQQD